MNASSYLFHFDMAASTNFLSDGRTSFMLLLCVVKKEDKKFGNTWDTVLTHFVLKFPVSFVSKQSPVLEKKTVIYLVRENDGSCGFLSCW